MEKLWASTPKAGILIKNGSTAKLVESYIFGHMFIKDFFNLTLDFAEE